MITSPQQTPNLKSQTPNPEPSRTATLSPLQGIRAPRQSPKDVDPGKAVIALQTKSLKGVIWIVFFMLPMISSVVCHAFACEEFDGM